MTQRPECDRELRRWQSVRQSPGARKRRGFRPGPRPRGAAPWNPAKGIALGTIHFGWVWEEGLPRPQNVRVGPPPTPSQCIQRLRPHLLSQGDCQDCPEGDLALVFQPINQSCFAHLLQSRDNASGKQGRNRSWQPCTDVPSFVHRSMQLGRRCFIAPISRATPRRKPRPSGRAGLRARGGCRLSQDRGGI